MNERVGAQAGPHRDSRFVLMRGLARAEGHWGTFAERFRAAFPGAAVELPDLPGCGERRSLSAPPSIAGVLACMRGGLATGSPLVLVGLSMGSMVAYEWMRRHPGEVAGAVLINSSLGGLSPPWRRLRPAAAATLLRAATIADPTARERRLFTLTSARPELAEATVAAWAELARRQPVRRMTVARQLLAAGVYRARPLAPPVPPVLVLTASGDRMVDPACSRALARSIPGAALEVHPTAGHDLPLDDPDWVIAAIARWYRF